MNVFGATLRDAIPEASDEPSSTSAAVIEELPDASSCTEISLAFATGGTLSTIVTVSVTVTDAEFPLKIKSSYA